MKVRLLPLLFLGGYTGVIIVAPCMHACARACVCVRVCVCACVCGGWVVDGGGGHRSVWYDDQVR